MVQNLYSSRIHVEMLASKVMVSEGGPLGVWLSHEGGVLMNGTSALIKEILESSLVPFTL